MTAIVVLMFFGLVTGLFLQSKNLVVSAFALLAFILDLAFPFMVYSGSYLVGCLIAVCVGLAFGTGIAEKRALKRELEATANESAKRAREAATAERAWKAARAAKAAERQSQSAA